MLSSISASEASSPVLGPLISSLSRRVSGLFLTESGMNKVLPFLRNWKQFLVRVLKESDLCMIATHARVAKKIFEWIGLGAEAVDAGVLYVVDLPAGSGIAHRRQV